MEGTFSPTSSPLPVFRVNSAVATTKPSSSTAAGIAASDFFAGPFCGRALSSGANSGQMAVTAEMLLLFHPGRDGAAAMGAECRIDQHAVSADRARVSSSMSAGSSSTMSRRFSRISSF